MQETRDTSVSISDNLTFIRLNIRLNSSRPPFWLLLLGFGIAKKRFQTSILESNTASAIRTLVGICTLFCAYMVK